MDKEPKVLLFFTKEDVYSQFHPCHFEVDGTHYSCTEQYMMHQKAITFNDEEMATKIMNTKKPNAMKSFGRKVRNFDEDVWTSKCRDIVFKGNLAKFSQNEDFKKKLLATGQMIIAEASPFDRRWGIGLGKSDPKAQNPKEWCGKNWLGEAIMKVRDELNKS